MEFEHIYVKMGENIYNISKILWQINDHMRILKLNGPIWIPKFMLITGSSNRFQNCKFWILANYYGKIDLEILAPEVLSELLLLCRKPQTSNDLIRSNIETTNPFDFNRKFYLQENVVNKFVDSLKKSSWNHVTNWL